MTRVQELSELRREAERLEGAAFSVRKRVSVLDGAGASEAWEHAALAAGHLEQLADELRRMEKVERGAQL